MEDTSLAKEPLFSPPNQPAQAAEQPMEQMAQVVGRQILDNVLTVFVSQLL